MKDVWDKREFWIVTETPDEPAAGQLWRGLAEGPMHALDLFALGEGFATYTDVVANDTPGTWVDDDDQERVWAIFTNTVVYAIREADLPVPFDQEVWIVTQPNGDVEVLSSRPRWNWAADGSVVRVASIDGGDSLVVTPEPRSLTAMFDVTGWTDEEVDALAGEVTVQGESSDTHPSAAVVTDVIAS